MTDSPTSTPARRRVITERRRRPLLAGLTLAVGGLVVTIVGALVLSAGQAAQVLAPSDRTELPDPLEFDAEDRSYAVILLPTTVGIPFVTDPPAQLSCDVTRSDGSTVTVRGSRQGARVETDFGTSIGAFEATPGTTTVACAFRDVADPRGYFVAVAPERQALRTAGLAGAVAGVAAMAAGAALIVVGVRGRQRIIPADPDPGSTDGHG